MSSSPSHSTGPELFRSFFKNTPGDDCQRFKGPCIEQRHLPCRDKGTLPTIRRHVPNYGNCLSHVEIWHRYHFNSLETGVHFVQLF